VATKELSMILFHDAGFGLNDAHRILTERGLTVNQDGNAMSVQWEDGPILRLRLVSGQRIQQEAEKIGAGTPYAIPLSECNARFEITFDNLAEVLDEINTLIEVQTTLQEATQGFLYNTWNRHLSAHQG
jgi:hypothetical protein